MKSSWIQLILSRCLFLLTKNSDGPNARWARFILLIGTTVIASSFFHKYQKTIKAVPLRPKISCVDGARFIHVWSPRYVGSLGRLLNQFIFSVSLLFLRSSLLKVSDVQCIVASSPHPMVIFGALLWSRRLSVPLIFESRDLWPNILVNHAEMPRWHPYVLLMRLCERVAVTSANALLTPKQLEYKYYAESFNRTDVTWIPNTSKRHITVRKDIVPTATLFLPFYIPEAYKLSTWYKSS